MRAFVRRLALHGGVAVFVLTASLAIGAVGYHTTEGWSWLDSILNASMILSGMGPVGEVRTAAGKIFASAYAIFSGTVFLVSVGLLVAPIVHRVLHAFHLEAEE
jgi:hypothetical protein